MAELFSWTKTIKIILENGSMMKAESRHVQRLKGIGKMNSPHKTTPEVTAEEKDYVPYALKIIPLWPRTIIADRLQQQADEIAQKDERIIEMDASRKEYKIENHNLQSRLDKAIGTLMKYGKHGADCLYIMSVVGGYDNPSPCSCGYTEALTSVQGEKT